MSLPPVFNLNRKQRRMMSALNKGVKPMARKQEEIQQEYGQLCAQNGERAFQIKVLQAEIERNEQRILQLGKEMEEAKKAAAPQAQGESNEEAAQQSA